MQFRKYKKAILKGFNVACENKDSFRAYGDFRFVLYAQFLNKNFYPWYNELCYKIGADMKTYFEGHNEYLEHAENSQKMADDFMKKFFGRIK